MLNFQQIGEIVEKFLDVLEKSPLFQEIRREDLLRLLLCLGARRAYFDKKEIVMEQGTPASSFGVVLSGSIQISQIDFYGNRCIIGNINPGEIFAEAFVCAGIEELPVSVISNERSCILFIEYNRIQNICANSCSFHRTLIYNLMKDLASKTVTLQERAFIIAKRTTREKLLAYLMTCAARFGRASFEIPFTRQELADYLEVDRSGLSAEIGKLRAEGILESKRSYFKLLKHIEN